MMNATDLGGGRGWLDAGAAASIARIDHVLGHPLQITEAGRTWARQNVHFQAYQRYLAGGPWAPIALSPDAPSIHQLGNAADSDEAQKYVALMAEHGWIRTVYRNGKLVEPWHFEYAPHRDQHRTERPGSGASMTPTTPAESDEEEDDMPKNSGFIYRAATQKADQRTVLICNYGSGIFHEYTNGVSAGDSAYNASIAKAFDIPGPFAEISESHAISIKKSLKS